MANVWEPPFIWNDQECWIIGAGLSIFDQFEIPVKLREQLKNREVPLSELSLYMGDLRDRNVIGINMAVTIADWIDFLFFGDSDWFFRNRQKVDEAKVERVSCDDLFEKERYRSIVKHMHKDKKKNYGISNVPGYVCWNKNSGLASLSLAYQLGAKRIILVGFDMDSDCIDSKDRYHIFGFHYEQKTSPPDKNKREEKFRRMKFGLPAIAKDARRLGVEIINANPESAIEEFPKANVKELL